MDESRVSSHHSTDRCGEPPASRDSWVAELIDPVREWRYRWVLAREAYERGYRAAWDAGRRALLEELAAAQRDACPESGVLGSPDYVVMETRRYGPSGRAGAGDPRPEDYHGGGVVW